MTSTEYQDYVKRVDRFFKREGINCLTGGSEESYFSYRPCECCSRLLGGTREHCTGYNPTTKEVYEYEVCIDCVCFAAYGQLDDMTMMDITEEGE